MPGSLRNSSGRPNLRARLAAALVVLALVALTAPVIVLPVLRALVGSVF